MTPEEKKQRQKEAQARYMAKKREAMRSKQEDSIPDAIASVEETVIAPVPETPAPKTLATKRWRVRSPIRFNGQRAVVGDIVTLSDADLASALNRPDGFPVIEPAI